MSAAELSELALGLERLPCLMIRLPEVQKREEIGTRMIKLGMSLAGFLKTFERIFAGILNAESGGDDKDFPKRTFPLGLEDHPANRRIDRELSELTTDFGQPMFDIQGTQLFQQLVSATNRFRRWRFEERKCFDLP